MNPRRVTVVGAAGLAVIVGGLVLAGWAFDVAALRNLVPGSVPMMANTAVAFVLAGVALGLGRRPGGRIAATGLMLIAGATLWQYLTGWNLRIDELLFRDSDSPFRGPGRMALTTAVSLLALGTALFLSRSGPVRRRRGAEVLGGISALLALFEIERFVLGATQPAGHTPMAVPTALVLMALAIGLIVSVPDGWLLARAQDPGLGGMLIRRLLPANILLSMMLGKVAQGLGWHDAWSVAMVVTVGAFGLSAATLWCVATVEQLERARRTTEAARKEALEQLQNSEQWLADAQGLAHVGSWLWEIAPNQVTWSKELYRIYGLTPDHPAGYEEFLGVVHPEDRPRIRELIERQFRDHEPLEYESRAQWANGEVRHLFNRQVVITDTVGDAVRMMGTSLDITERKLQEVALRTALSEIKTLRGMLRICANCKRVSTEDGGWESLDSYVRDHTHAEFSHGLCPDCAKTWAAT